MHPLLRNSGWNGYWIDAASFLRKSEKSIIVLDPINSDQIEKGIDKGIKDYVGGNCTVSLMLMAIGGLFKETDSMGMLNDIPSCFRSGSGIHAGIIDTNESDRRNFK